MSKKLDTSNITNELQGASVFFKQPAIESPSLSPTEPSRVEHVPDDNLPRDHTVTPSHRHTSVPSHQETSVTVPQNTVTPSHRHTITPERPKKKHGFVVYRDQIESLEHIVATEWQRTGNKPEVGEIIREALDYIIDKKQKEIQP